MYPQILHLNLTGVPPSFFDIALFFPATDVFLAAGFFFAGAGFFAIIVAFFFTVTAAFAISNSPWNALHSLCIPEESPLYGMMDTTGYYKLCIRQV
jgi:hypothetical protein